MLKTKNFLVAIFLIFIVFFFTTSSKAVAVADINANPTTIYRGDSSLLSWTTNNVLSCMTYNGWSGQRPLNGQETVRPTQNATYVLRCYDAGGYPIIDQVTV